MSVFARPVSFVIPWYGHFAGGAEVAARSFAHALAARGAEVDVLTTCARSPSESWWRDTLPAGASADGAITIRRFPVDSDGEARFVEVNAKLVLGETIAEAHQREFVRHSINSRTLVEHVRATSGARDVIALPYTQGLIHDAVVESGAGVLAMPCLHDEPQAQWTTTREMLASARGVLFLSDAEKRLAIRLHGASVGRKLAEQPVVGIGVEASPAARALLADADRLTDIRARLKLPARYHMYMGRKEVGKGVSTLVAWYRHYRASGGDATLVFMGGGDASLVPAEPGFRDLGLVGEEEKVATLSGAVALANLSRNESFSIVVFEAWLARVPVVVAKACAVTAELVAAAGGGIAAGDESEFAAALATLDHLPTRDAVSARGERHAREHFDWDAVTDRLARALEAA